MNQPVPPPTVGADEAGNRKLAVLLAMAMFVLVVDTSIMNVSITAVAARSRHVGQQRPVRDRARGSGLGGVHPDRQQARRPHGRKRAYMLGLLAYAIGALAMILTQSMTTIVIFWAIIGGFGASLLLPAMQSLIHGNFQGAAQKKTYALVGAAAAVGAAIGPLIGGFVTTYLSWRVGFGWRS